MYYVAALMCTIVNVMGILVGLLVAPLVYLGLALQEWKDTLQERRERSDLRSLEGGEKEEPDDKIENGLQ